MPTDPVTSGASPSLRRAPWPLHEGSKHTPVYIMDRQASRNGVTKLSRITKLASLRGTDTGPMPSLCPRLPLIAPGKTEG